MFSNGEPDESSLYPYLTGGRLLMISVLGARRLMGVCQPKIDCSKSFTECRISVSFTKSIFSRVDFLSHEVVPEGLRSDAKQIKRVTEFSFLTSKKGVQSFLGALNYYSLLIQAFAVYAPALHQLKEEDFEPGGDLSVSRQGFAKLQQKIGDAPILRHFDRQKEVHWVLSSTLMQEHDGKIHPVCFCGRVLKETEMNYHPAEKEVLTLLLLLKTCYTRLTAAQFTCTRDFQHWNGYTHPSHCSDGRPNSPQGKGLCLRTVTASWVNEFCGFGGLFGDGYTTHEGIVYRPHESSFDGSAKTEKYGGYDS
ncbi:LOW QUALITY PROTEIN: hypothetical protein PHMEG_00011282 [Phytophthora megakarya]|uniref:Reverse transcriptase/retrotransposon-derived protein RNase H-like domain-containing protein n=1 Tax=Phytophthora megakarya TaxID=4795 RepID=A0A225WE51_9STRA|nr:LOW QUALITY PROTEIN: hypothetical protein PHMEG_00011282 [Phytophthora megakarya]